MTANRPADGPADAGGLKRVLGRYDVTMIVMGSIIGAGVFRAPAGIARDMGSLGGVLAVWGFGGLVAFSGALVFAELGGMMPHTGGEYVFIRAGAGRFAAFLFGWISLTAIVSSAIGFVAGVFVEHLEALLRYGSPDLAFGSGSKRALAAALIVALAALNARGMRLGASVQNVSMLAKNAGMLTVVALGVAVWFGWAEARPAEVAAPGSWQARGLGAALVGIMFTYGGWQNVASVAGEIRRPERNLPLGTLVGTACVIALYLALNAALIGILGLDGVAATNTPVATAAGAVVAWGEPLVAALIMVSTFAITQSLLMLAPRIYLAMAEDGVFFRGVGRVHARWGTPVVAIVLQAAFAIGHVFAAAGIGDLVTVCSLSDWVFFTICGATLFVLRVRRPDAPRPYRAWGYPVLPAIFLVCSAWALVQMARDAERAPAFQALGLFAIGAVLYLVWSRRSRATSGAPRR